MATRVGQGQHVGVVGGLGDVVVERRLLEGALEVEVEDERLGPVALLGQHADDRAAAQVAQFDDVAHARSPTSGRSNSTERPSGPIER